MDQQSNDSPEFDSWEQQDDPGPGEVNETTSLSAQFSGLNVNAKPFVPNVHAPAFVPNFNTQQESESPSNDENLGEFGEQESEVTESPETPEAESQVMDDRPFKLEEPPDIDSESVDTSPEPSDGNGAALPKFKAADEGTDERKKEPVNVIFIGHVDAGKSTIGGHIMYLTGGVDKRTLEKYEREAKEKNRESWYLSWALDTNQEERDKGKTVEVGRASFETEKKHFTILDAPGHKSFVPNMIGGAAQADLAVLVISARKGEFETGFERGGQTREHAMLAKTAGVKHLVVLINKMDDPTVDWSETRYEECKEKLSPFLKKVGFNPKKDIYFIPVSGITGANLKESAMEKGCPWYKGPPFIQYIDELPPLMRDSSGPLRMPISDKYKDMGTILLGKIESGMIYKGTNLVLMPNKHPIEILQIVVDEQEKESAKSGENVKLKVRGIEEEDVLPGFVLCEPSNLCHSCKVFKAQIVIIEHKSIICSGYSAVLHIHTAVEEAQIVGLLAQVDKKTGAKSKQRPRFIKQDQVAIAKFKVSEGICIEAFEDFPQMGRFTLRDEGKTIAIGKVLKLLTE